jgi:ubiquinone/menaquinone biosynthesis C-methylase UbiE
MVVRKLAKDGANVVGVDFSPRLLETAPGLEASERLGFTYAEADSTAPGLLQKEAFDAVACNFRLSDTDHRCGALANVAPLLGPGGRLGLVVDRVAEPPSDIYGANKRPGTAGTPAYLVGRALRPPSPSVHLP